MVRTARQGQRALPTKIGCATGFATFALYYGNLTGGSSRPHAKWNAFGLTIA